MLKHFYGIEKHALKEKAFGCYRHKNLSPDSVYLRGFSDDFIIPVSRWTEIKNDDIVSSPTLNTLLGSEEVGPCLIEDQQHRSLYIFNHFEYDSDTLKQEYDRDISAGKQIEVPQNYYPKDDPKEKPENRWRSHGHLLYGNWINSIYQSTPFQIDKIGN